MSFDEYLALDRFSNSGAGKLLQSAQHFLEWKNNPPESTDAQALGTAGHSGILEPKEFYDRYVARPDGIDRRTKAGKEIYESLVAANPGKEVLTAEDYKAVEGMIEAVYSHPKAFELLQGGVVERAALWTETVDGVEVPCKARLDYLRDDNMIVDVKTCERALDFEGAVLKWGYHRQAALYTDGISMITGRAAQFRLIVVEKQAPYGVKVYQLNDAAIQSGRIQYMEALRLYARCLKSGYWPGYSGEVETIGLPAWVK